MKARDMQDCLLGHGIKPSVQRLALPLPVDSRSLTVRFEEGTVDEVQLYYKGYCENCRMQSEG